VTAFNENVCFSGSFSKDFVISERNLPDLVIRNEDIVIEPEPRLGDTVVISVTVWNFGKKEAEDFWVIILIDDVVKYKEHVAILKPDESVTIEYEWTILYSGSFVIQAIADPPEGMT
jgi:subtilase family serine protease